jgi:tetratricopeptide (TPR) repeat protein
MLLRWMRHREKRREYDTRMAEVTLLLDRKDFPLAEHGCERALSLVEELCGEDHPEVVTALYALSASRFAQGKLDCALDPCHRAIRIAEHSAVATEPRLPRLLGLEAAILEQRGDVDGAIAILRRMLAGYDRMRAPDTGQIAETLERLGLLLVRRGRPEEAELFFERAIPLRERISGGKGPAMAELFYNLATCLIARKKLADAEVKLKNALGLAERAAPPEPLLVASILHNWGVIAEGRGELAEAGELYERALVAWGQIHEDDHSELRPTLFRLAQVRHEEGRHREAERLYRRVLAMYEQDPSQYEQDPSHDRAAVIACYSKLASLCFALRRYADAEAYGKQALKWTDKGPRLPREAHVPALNLAEIYRAEERHDEAESLYRRALKEAGEASDAAPRDVQSILTGLATVLRALRREAEAREVEADARRRAVRRGPGGA